jgi:hypothetical protein
MIGGGEKFADVPPNPSCVNGRIYFLVASEGAVGQLSLFSFEYGIITTGYMARTTELLSCQD